MQIAVAVLSGQYILMSPNLPVTGKTDMLNRQCLSLAIKCYLLSLPNSFPCVR